MAFVEQHRRVSGALSLSLQCTRERGLSPQELAEAQHFLSSPPQIARPAVWTGTEVGSAELIGPYRLELSIGVGGKGSVWLAERSDGLLKRKIALKLPHLSSAGAGLGERMARERDILAALEHPNIARLYDAGLAADGRPYLALEYIEGQPIDRYCAAQRLDIRARLSLVQQVARGRKALKKAPAFPDSL
jgi:serine/threonine protein kinase